MGWVTAAKELAAAVRSRVCQGIANGVRIATTATFFSPGPEIPRRSASRIGDAGMFAAGFHETIGTRFGNFVGSDRDGGPEGMLVPDHGSISRWLEGLKAGNAADIERLWDRYFHRLVGLAATRLPGHARRDFDEEDVALSAFHSFCHRAADSQFPWLDDRNDLWRLLATITARKAISRIRQQTRQKRGGGHVLGESAVIGRLAEDEGMARFLSREPAPRRQPSSPTILIACSPSWGIGAQDDRRAQARGSQRRGDRRRTGHLATECPSQAGVDPGDLEGVDAMSSGMGAGAGNLPLATLLEIEEVCDRFEHAWLAGERPDLASFLAESPGPARARMLHGLLTIELDYRLSTGETPDPDLLSRSLPRAP